MVDAIADSTFWQALLAGLVAIVILASFSRIWPRLIRATGPVGRFYYRFTTVKALTGSSEARSQFHLRILLAYVVLLGPIAVCIVNVESIRAIMDGTKKDEDFAELAADITAPTHRFVLYAIAICAYLGVPVWAGGAAEIAAVRARVIRREQQLSTLAAEQERVGLYQALDEVRDEPTLNAYFAALNDLSRRYGLKPFERPWAKPDGESYREATLDLPSVRRARPANRAKPITASSAVDGSGAGTK
ncbi:MAG TPA: hypothetical protein VGN12_05740 [Pirellulales bacterium]